MSKVFTKLSISTLNIGEIVKTLEQYKKIPERRNDSIRSIYAAHQDLILFLIMYESCCVSEA